MELSHDTWLQPVVISQAGLPGCMCMRCLKCNVVICLGNDHVGTSICNAFCMFEFVLQEPVDQCMDSCAALHLGSMLLSMFHCSVSWWVNVWPCTWSVNALLQPLRYPNFSWCMAMLLTFSLVGCCRMVAVCTCMGCHLVDRFVHEHVTGLLIASSLQPDQCCHC